MNNEIENITLKFLLADCRHRETVAQYSFFRIDIYFIVILRF